MAPFNVVIADDHPIVLLGVRELIERDKNFIVVGEALCSDGLIELLNDKQTDLIITDFNMPGNSPYGDGLKLIEYLRRNFPDIKILLLTMISNPLILSRLYELGVVGVIQKNQLHDDFETALTSIAQGRPFKNAAPEVTCVMPTEITVGERLSALTVKELEVLRLYVNGQSVTDIAKSQSRSVKTISAQKNSAMRKLEVSSDQDLIAYCLEKSMFSK